jgi:hypothetical protein
MSDYENQKLPIDKRAAGLYAGIEDVRNLSLSIQRADDFDIQDQLENIAVQIGIEGEATLLEYSQKNNLYFFPKYLNETLKDEPIATNNEFNTPLNDFKIPGIDFYPKYLNDTIPETSENVTGAAITGHFPDPRSHGQ